MNEQEQKAFKMYGKMPAKNLLTKMQKDRKYFDSGDYMMNKAGVGNALPLGTAIPTPEGVPHASPPGPNSPGVLSSSPTGNIPTPSPGIAELNQNPFGQAQNGGHSPTQTQAIPVNNGQPHPSLAHHRGSVGVGISPAATSDAMEVPANAHARRSSESHGARVSPPGTLRDNANPSSFPIHHIGGMGSSPVKASSLARRLDEDMES